MAKQIKAQFSYQTWDLKITWTKVFIENPQEQEWIKVTTLKRNIITVKDQIIDILD